MHADLERLPPEFLDRLRRILPGSQGTAALDTFRRPPPTTFRANTLKTTGPEIREQLTAAGFQLEPVPWYREAFILRRGRLRELQETDAYRTGAIYVQGLSSMLPPLALQPEPQETVLDIAAAPGSKTTQLACLMQGRGRILANDNNRVRFFKLRANVLQQGAANVELAMLDGLAIGRQRPDHFDRVLADVPCSAEGRFQTAEPASYKFWKPAKIKEMVRKQKSLLYAGLLAVRPGGTLVYSTCTFAPEENEGVVDWALRKFAGRVALEPVRLECPNRLPGLLHWEKDAFDPSVRLTQRILPNDTMEGFYVARFRKTEPIATPAPDK